VRRILPWAAWLPGLPARLLVRALLITCLTAVLLQLVLLATGAGASAWVDRGRLVAVSAACGLCLLRAAFVRTDRLAWAAMGAGLAGWTFNAARWLVDGPRTDPVLLPGVDTEAAALRAADRVLAGLLGAFVIDGLTLFVTASAGVALAPRHGTDGSMLLRCADVAMYQAKRGGGGAAVYRPLADPHSRSRLGAATELKRAIAAGDIVCHYQPQVDVATRVPVGVEALARWADGRRGLVPPEEFLGLAEQTGLMPELAQAVLRAALTDVRAWRASVPHLRIAVNLSASSLLDSRLPDRIEAALAGAGLPADALALEIADGAVPDEGRARATVARLHEMGIRVALDDYGTGRSSVVLLRQLPVDQLKLDGGLVGAVVADGRARAIVRHTVLMAHALHIQVVAKGVEDAATLEMVDQLGCDHAQGFLLAPPMPGGDLTGWLAGRPTPVHG
jgi:diguanylate cyclase